jgi:hypothetical protein
VVAGAVAVPVVVPVVVLLVVGLGVLLMLPPFGVSLMLEPRWFWMICAGLGGVVLPAPAPVWPGSASRPPA